EACLKQAWRAEELRRQSPLGALRAGSMERAVAAAELTEPERCALWLLLLMWAARASGADNDAARVAELLKQKELPRLTGQWARYAGTLLGRIATEADGLELASRVLSDDGGWRALCAALRDRQQWAEATEAARHIQAERERALAWGEIAQSQFRAGA